MRHDRQCVVVEVSSLSFELGETLELVARTCRDPEQARADSPGEYQRPPEQDVEPVGPDESAELLV